MNTPEKTQLDLLITSANCLLPNGTSVRLAEANIGIKDGKFAYIGDAKPDAEKHLDLKGLHLFPGAIDSQVHFREPGLTHKEDFHTGTHAALCGGITSVFEMPNTNPATLTKADVEDKISRVTKGDGGRAYSHMAFYVGASHQNIDQLETLEKLPGISGIKVFMGSSTGNLLVPDEASLEALMRKGKRRVIFHAEDEARLVERKHLAVDGKNVKLHPEWRDVKSAVNATELVLRLCERTRRPVHILHVTTYQELELIKKAKEKLGELVSCEVTPQHLTLFGPDIYEKIGTLAQMNPPIRDHEQQQGLLRLLKEKVPDVIGSDHAPHTREEKAKPYPQSPSGMPGVQTLLPIMLNHVNQGHLSLEQLGMMVCERPRQLFGCAQKGRIEIGLDADITIIDLKRQMTITNSQQKSKVGWTPFDGMTVTGIPVMAFLDGTLAMQDGEAIGAPRGRPIHFS